MYTIFAWLFSAALAAGPVVVPVPSLPIGAVAVSASADGSGPVSVTLPSAPGRTTYVCAVEAAPTIAGARILQTGISGIVGSPTFTAAPNGTARQNFNPCKPATTPETPIVFTATATDNIEANIWGYQQ
jgi:hypothetical protein